MVSLQGAWGWAPPSASFVPGSRQVGGQGVGGPLSLLPSFLCPQGGEGSKAAVLSLLTLPALEDKYDLGRE